MLLFSILVVDNGLKINIFLKNYKCAIPRTRGSLDDYFEFDSDDK